MHFPTGTVIPDHKNERRWQVRGRPRQLPRLKIWEVHDQASDMERQLELMTLDYAGLPANDRDFAIQELRDSFLGMVRILCEGSGNFLSEPVDYLTFRNDADPMGADLRNDEPALVLAKTHGFILTPYRSPGDPKTIKKLNRFIQATLKTLNVLHNRQVVIQALPLEHIWLNPVTWQPYFSGIETLIRMDDFCGYNPNRAVLAPDPRFAAPETRDPRGRLTPATDIYAVGKLALQLLMGDAYARRFTENNPFPADTQAIVNALNLPDPWSRFLSLCLQTDPARRFPNTAQALEFLLPPNKRAVTTGQSRDRQRPDAAPSQAARGKWVYRENRQLPPAMLLIWGERLSERGQLFNFRALYKDYAKNFSLGPRLFFQTYRGSTPISDNPFFAMLQDTFRLEVVPLDGQQNPVGVLNHWLDPHLAGIKNLILVGGADEAGVQAMLQHPQARNWRIHWVRGQGAWNPTTRVESVVDGTQYLRAKTS